MAPSPKTCLLTPRVQGSKSGYTCPHEGLELGLLDRISLRYLALRWWLARHVDCWAAPAALPATPCQVAVTFCTENWFGEG